MKENTILLMENMSDFINTGNVFVAHGDSPQTPLKNNKFLTIWLVLIQSANIIHKGSSALHRY